MARPTDLTPEVSAKICDLVRRGNFTEVAAKIAGISATALYVWKNKGSGENARSPYKEFVQALNAAEAECEAACLGNILAAANNGTWQAGAWLLERKFAERWAQAQKLEIVVEREVSGMLDKLKRSLPSEEFRNVLYALNRDETSQAPIGLIEGPREIIEPDE